MSNTSTETQINFLPELFPEKWANEWGEDQFGMWMAFTFKNVRQVFRWILPGTFLMGSPDSEKQRVEERELQHPVSLTQGYWLAETACSQALWQAVMDDNPSRFKEDENNPVENVSWDDVQDFLGRLNELIPCLNAALPSEAQWEYACRAGTTTPFSFGENITPDQVNYDGGYPYADGKIEVYRKKTVPVKSLPANSGGLFEMHGNVWEWCQDWYGDYSETAINNPTGVDIGSDRVLRGGSWITLGRSTRSAYRDWDGSVSRDYYTGFRFAPGQAKSRQAEPQVAASERGRDQKIGEFDF